LVAIVQDSHLLLRDSPLVIKDAYCVLFFCRILEEAVET
jgi:hypothetical protein